MPQDKETLLDDMRFSVEETGYSIVELCENFEEETKDILPEVHEKMVNLLKLVDELKEIIGWD